MKKTVKPLSNWTYYRNNPRRVWSMLSIIILSVFLLFTLQMLIQSAFRFSYVSNVEPKKFYSSVLARESPLTPALIEKLNACPGTQQVLPGAYGYSNFRGLLGDASDTKVYFLKETDMSLMMERMGTKLAEGRLPAPGSNEIVVHQAIAHNKKLKLGSEMGSLVDKRERLSGRYVISGLLEGKAVVSYASFETLIKQYGINPSSEYRNYAFMLPQPERLAEMNRCLASLPPGNYDITTYNTTKLKYEEGMEGITLLLTAISFIVILIVTISAGFLCYIYFFQRRSEFGLLAAIGYSRHQITVRAFIEIGGLALIGYGAGLAGGVLSGILLNIVLFVPRGEPLILWQVEYGLSAACIPLFVAVTGMVPIWRMLKRLDPIAIIERVI
ncbi:ABC transporter permease [Paenibacillus sp. YN15]|uniref:ABC transporter permease n=1 Tax=Paenibacillus sp. YN15 TaxID=1742774 RepID=UPI000DCCB1E5|nr:ABC transporter permease [Paenibacillus sp. YN15]RAU98163.1 hypothetical protein DQG13_17910 [Paenibacillus sp. YN15]